MRVLIHALGPHAATLARVVLLVAPLLLVACGGGGGGGTNY